MLLPTVKPPPQVPWMAAPNIQLNTLYIILANTSHHSISIPRMGFSLKHPLYDSGIHVIVTDYISFLKQKFSFLHTSVCHRKQHDLYCIEHSKVLLPWVKIRYFCEGGKWSNLYFSTNILGENHNLPYPIPFGPLPIHAWYRLTWDI